MKILFLNSAQFIKKERKKANFLQKNFIEIFRRGFQEIKISLFAANKQKNTFFYS
jgi:hypothetical protein